MPKPQHERHTGHGSDRTVDNQSTTVDIPMTELSSNSATADNTSSTTPPPAYSNEGCLFPDSDDDVSRTSSNSTISSNDNYTRHTVVTMANVEHDDITSARNDSDVDDDALPSYQVAIRSLGIDNPLRDQITSDEAHRA